MIESLGGRVAVVTGAANGIGRALVTELYAEGMSVVAVDLDEEGLMSLASDLPNSEAGRVVSYKADVTEFSQVEAIRAVASAAFGSVHLLCNNAGIIGQRGLPVWEEDPHDWRRVMDVNVVGVLHGLRAFIPGMIECRESCHVVNTASMMGWVASGQVASQYTASKHAVVGLTETLAMEVRGKIPWLGVSVLCPGPVETGFRRRNRHFGFSEESDSIVRERAWDEDPSRIVVGPRMVARAVIDAVKSGAFYVFPNPGSQERLQHRFEHVLRSVRPSAPTDR